MNAERFYLIDPGAATGATARGPYAKSEAAIRATAEPGAKVITAAQLEALRARPLAGALHIGQRVICRPAGLRGVVYALAPGVVYVKLDTHGAGYVGEIISSPYDMLDLDGAIVKG